VLSHLQHVATQVVQLVASVKGLGHKLSKLLFNVCPSVTCAATSWRPRLYLDVTWNPMVAAYQSEKWNSVTAATGLSLQSSSSSDGIPFFSDWSNETVSQMHRNMASAKALLGTLQLV